MVAESIADQGLDLAVLRCGVDDVLIPHASREQQLASQGLDLAGVTETLRQLLRSDAEAIPFIAHHA